MKHYHLLAFLILLHSPIALFATRLVNVQTVDNKCIVLHFQDGAVEYNWDTKEGSCNGWGYLFTEGWRRCNDKDQYLPYGQPLNTEQVQHEGAFRILSGKDKNLGKHGVAPVKIHRKSKVWEASFDEDMPAMHHWIYLELPFALQRGMEYQVVLDTSLHADLNKVVFTFDEMELRSPSIKISNLGYERLAAHKTADVYHWMGDGGGRDYSRLEGNAWHLYDINKREFVHSGKLHLHMNHGPEPVYKHDFTGADVWECDFSDFATAGNYKLVVEGIGCSLPFVIGEGIFEEAFKTAMQGMYYLRMGSEETPTGGFPRSRLPLYKQGVDPEGFTVYISQKDMVTGVNPDDREFYAEKLSGEIAQQTWGGWVDAFDNDQRPFNYIGVFDILLTYYLNPDAFTDGQLYIPETENGIPDILDEALWEINWWLRMRDAKGGYLTGLTNIVYPETINYAGAPCAWQGWCVAAGCAMVADCFRINGNEQLRQFYQEAAIEAYQWALRQEAAMLQTSVAGLRGKDLKMTAAAYLFNITGDALYEKAFLKESEVKSATSKVGLPGKWEQQFAAVGYILSPNNHSDIRQADWLKASIIHQAKVDYVDFMDKSPTKAVRFTSGWEGKMQTSNEISLVAIAHRLTADASEKTYFEKGLYAEAEWTLGRNPLGLVQMTGLTEQSITQAFAPGRRDGHPGLVPGWTPYMCRDGWKNSDNIVRCEWYTNRNYPRDKTVWPYGEHYWNSRYNVPNGETTPHDTMRQKIVLYGYLWGMK